MNKKWLVFLGSGRFQISSIFNTSIQTNQPYIQTVKYSTSSQYTFYLINTYLRHPGTTFHLWEEPFRILQKELKRIGNQPIIIVGDFNACPKEHPCKQNNKSSIHKKCDTMFHQLQKDFGLVCLNTAQKTCINKKNSKIYDLILTNRPSLFTSKARPRIDIKSNNQHFHRPVTATLALKNNQATDEIKYQYGINWNSSNAHQLEQNIPWDTLTQLVNCTSATTLEQTSQTIETIFKTAAIKTFGLKRYINQKNKQHIPWESNTYIQKLQEQYIQAKKTNPDEIQGILKKIKDHIYELNMFQQHAASATKYNTPIIIKKATKKFNNKQNPQIPDKIHCPIHHTLINNCEALTNTAELLFNTWTNKILINKAIVNKLTKLDTQLALYQLQNKTPGDDTLIMNFYKFAGQAMINFLTLWYNKLLQLSKLPQNMTRDTKITIPKYSNNASLSTKQNPTNYRNIGLQNAQFKIFDAILKNKLTKWFKDTNQIHLLQGGFQENKGTLEQIYVLNEVFHHTKKLHTIFIDLQKAYDTIHRPTLIKKLEKANAPIEILQMVKLMYTNTTSTVKTNEYIGREFKTNCGLIQGSISSPLLFNFYINDLITKLVKSRKGIQLGNITLNTLFFADDIAIFADTYEKVQCLWDICKLYAQTSKLTISMRKSKIINKWNSKMPDHNDIPLQELINNNLKYLGIPFNKYGIDYNKLFYTKGEVK